MGTEINSDKGKEKEKKTRGLSFRRGAGCEIGGLVALGGALAAAALIAALTNRARKRRPTATQKSVKDPPKPTGLTKILKNRSHCSCAEGGNEGLRSLLRAPSQSVQGRHTSCFFCDEGLSRIGSAQINFSELVVVQSLILEANVNSSKETYEKASDDMETGNMPAFEFDDVNIRAGTPVNNIEASPLLNDREGEGAPKVDERASVKTKGRGEDEGSEGTPDSSMESSAEAVWPAESIEAKMLEFKETKANCLYATENNGKGVNGANEASRAKDGAKEDEITGNTMEILDPEKDMGFIMVNHASLSTSSRSRFLLWLMMLIMPLLLLLAHHIATSNNSLFPNFNYDMNYSSHSI